MLGLIMHSNEQAASGAKRVPEETDVRAALLVHLELLSRALQM